MPRYTRRPMQIGAVLLLLLLSSSDRGHAAKPTREKRPELTLDQTRQLIISGGDQKQRTELMRLLEGLRETTLRVLRQPPQSYPAARPILCILMPEYPEDAEPSLEVLEDPGGMKLQIWLRPLQGTPPPRLERALFAAFLSEIAIRPISLAPSPGGNPPTPRWLVDVLVHEHHRPNPLLAPISLRELIDSGNVPSPVQILARPESDPRPSSPQDIDLARCLLNFLLSRPEGKESLESLLRTDLTEKTLPRLLACFPNMPRTEAQLLREWILHVAALGTQGERIALDGPQTEAEIRNLLLFDYTDPASGLHSVIPLEQFTEILRLPDCREMLFARQLEWESLRDRGHFLYAHIIDAYAGVCNALAGGRTQGIVRQLQLATLERESVAARLERIRDHLNWFEAVAAPRNRSAKLIEFYRVLETKPAISEAVKRALDKAELELHEREAKQDIERALDELRSRPSLNK